MLASWIMRRTAGSDAHPRSAAAFRLAKGSDMVATVLESQPPCDIRMVGGSIDKVDGER